MDVISLPQAAIDASLDDAIAAMRFAKRSGIVGVSPSDPETTFLFKASDVVLEKAQGGKTLGDVSRRWQIRAPAIAPKAGYSVRTIRQTPAETLFAGTSALYLLGPVQVDGSVQVVTRSERFAAQLGAAPADCYCIGPEQHEAGPPAGGLCRVCGDIIVCII